jgi:hypothetical protein
MLPAEAEDSSEEEEEGWVLHELQLDNELKNEDEAVVRGWSTGRIKAIAALGLIDSLTS